MAEVRATLERQLWVQWPSDRLWLAEYRASSLSGLWTYTIRRDMTEGARSYESRVHHGTLLKRAQAASFVGQEMGGIPTSWAPSNRTNSEPSLASPRSHAMPPVPQFNPT